jgi:hypothetical protein
MRHHPICSRRFREDDGKILYGVAASRKGHGGGHALPVTPVQHAVQLRCPLPTNFLPVWLAFCTTLWLARALVALFQWRWQHAYKSPRGLSFHSSPYPRGSLLFLGFCVFSLSMGGVHLSIDRSSLPLRRCPLTWKPS